VVIFITREYLGIGRWQDCCLCGLQAPLHLGRVSSSHNLLYALLEQYLHQQESQIQSVVAADLAWTTFYRQRLKRYTVPDFFPLPLLSPKHFLYTVWYPLHT
jgi:hypothetical protein